MAAEPEREPFMDIAGIMREFAGYLEKERLPEEARAYDEFGRELEVGVSRDRLAEISREVLESLRAGPSRMRTGPSTRRRRTVSMHSLTTCGNLPGSMSAAPSVFAGGAVPAARHEGMQQPGRTPRTLRLPSPRPWRGTACRCPSAGLPQCRPWSLFGQMIRGTRHRCASHRWIYSQPRQSCVY